MYQTIFLPVEWLCHLPVRLNSLFFALSRKYLSVGLETLLPCLGHRFVFFDFCFIVPKFCVKSFCLSEKCQQKHVFETGSGNSQEDISSWRHFVTIWSTGPKILDKSSQCFSGEFSQTHDEWQWRVDEIMSTWQINNVNKMHDDDDGSGQTLLN